MKLSRPLLGSLLIFLAVSSSAADTPPEWSATVNGLRGRFVIPAPQNHSADPFVKVRLELENTANVLGSRHVRMADESILAKVENEGGLLLPSNNGPYDGLSAIPETLIMPFGCTISFFINGHGLGVPPGTREIIDFGPGQSWIIPLADGHTYFLSGTFTVQRQPHDNRFLDWSGTLDLPKLPIAAF